MRRLVIGDIHGNYEALKTVFEKSFFDYNNDQLFVIGDVVDGHAESKKCIDELLKIKNCIFILGNHDVWAWDWMEAGTICLAWYQQGGKATIQSYNLLNFPKNVKPDVAQSHLNFFRSGIPYYLTEDNKLFVHGGFNLDTPIENQALKTLTWDRSLFEIAKNKAAKGIKKFTQFNEIYIGHTSTESYSLEPVNYCEVWNVDQGAGRSGSLTLMDVDSKEKWSSLERKILK